MTRREFLDAAAGRPRRKPSIKGEPGITWYSPAFSNSSVEERIVIRETDKWLHFAPLVPGGYSQRAKKASRSGIWFKTREEAVEHIRRNLISGVRSARRDLRRAREELAEFNARER